MRIVFVRHGETAHNTAMVITSGIPGGFLTDQGVQQVRDRAALLADFNAVAVWSSPLNRARQSAEIIAETLALPLVEDDGFRECDVGDLEGLGDDDAFARFNESLDRWYLEADLDFPLGPNGETAAAAIDRARSAVARVVDAHDSDDTVVVVSHQTFLQVAMTFLSSNLKPAFGHRRWISNAGVSVMHFDESVVTCLAWDGQPVNTLL